ncbi:hypothetical protein ABZS93_31685 [Streptomyces sp900116325]|uniref:hypothetical protein n=1 Tax=Streptomyces sp. 900116325 TaxID=3154295 RepID=UPI0033A483F3
MKNAPVASRLVDLTGRPRPGERPGIGSLLDPVRAEGPMCVGGETGHTEPLVPVRTRPRAGHPNRLGTGGERA